MGWWRETIDIVKENDPAARNSLEVLLTSYLHKLGDKDHDDDDRNDKTKKEKPDLEKSLFPCCFIKV